MGQQPTSGPKKLNEDLTTPRQLPKSIVLMRRLKWREVDKELMKTSRGCWISQQVGEQTCLKKYRTQSREGRVVGPPRLEFCKVVLEEDRSTEAPNKIQLCYFF
jgi:hypothetical protein